MKKGDSNTNFLKGKRKQPSAKMRARLQKEINSKCPFCDDEDVEYFEAHHIDEDPSNTIEHNLILTCKKCHSKIGEGVITQKKVIERKENLIGASSSIEIYKIDIVSKNNCWKKITGVKNAFELEWETGNDFPIFQFHILNNHSKTVVLSDVELQTKHLYSGLGDLPQPTEVPNSKVYHISIHGGKDVHKIEKFNGVQIPSKQAFIMQVEVFEQYKRELFNLEKRMILYFTLKFSNDIVVNLPRVLLNTKDDKSGVKIYLLS